MRNIVLKMSEDELEALLAMAEENAISMGCSDEEHSKPNKKRVKIINKMLKYNRRREVINY